MVERVLLVTGGGRGIGAATCRLAAARGYRVAVNYRQDAESAGALVREIEAASGSALAVQADVSQPADVERLFAEAEARLGPVTHFVNNAGLTGAASRLDEASVDTLRAVIDVNLFGALLCARAAAARMSRSRGGSGGAIVNVSSGAATLGSPGEWVWYAASKAAVDALTLGLARELARDGVRVNGVAPGLVDTSLHESSGVAGAARSDGSHHPVGTCGKPGGDRRDDPLSAIGFRLVRDRSGVASGRRPVSVIAGSRGGTLTGSLQALEASRGGHRSRGSPSRSSRQSA